MNLEKLEKLNQLKDAGALTIEEFLAEKAKLKNPELLTAQKSDSANIEQKEQSSTFYMLMHLSQYANFFTPFAGTVIPLIMWLMYKDNDMKIDRHGREILNWQLSFTIYTLVCVVLCVTIIGIPFAAIAFLAILFTTIIFPVIGGLKANDDEFYSYPLTLEILKINKENAKKQEQILLAN